jgi:acyl carrier protein
MLDYGALSRRVIELLNLDIEGEVDPTDNLYADLALDSFQALQLIVIIESLADTLMPPVDLPELYTMQDAFDYYATLVESERS